MFDQRMIASHQEAIWFALDQRPNVSIVCIGSPCLGRWLANDCVRCEHGKQGIDFPFAQTVKGSYLLTEKDFPVLGKEGRRE